MNIVTFQENENDAKDFLFRIRTIISGAMKTYEAAGFYLIHVDNWFGDRWLGFSGKLLGAVGVARKALTFPPFIPSRIISERYFSLVKDTDAFREVKQKRKIHIYQNSSQNLQRKIALIHPDSAFFWYSGNTGFNDRGCLMAYIPTPEGHWPWYTEFVSEPWRVSKLVEITRKEIDYFDKALGL